MARRASIAFLLAAAASVFGQAGGQVAIEMWPAEGRFSGEVSILPDCTARLVPVADLDRELSFPCGEPFAPPPGRYLHWVEGADRISPDHLILHYAGGPFQGRNLSIVRGTVPAGEVRFSGVPAESDLVLRLLHLDSHVAGDRLFFEFFRRLPAARAGEAVRLPEGRAVAFLYDLGKKEYRALGRPFSVESGKETLLASPTAPATTAVLAIFERPEELESRQADDLAPFLVIGDRRLAPDLRFGDAARVFAVWYEAAGPSARLELGSERWRIDETFFSLRAGKVETVRPPLLAKPRLTVQVQRPKAWLEKEVHLYLVAPRASIRQPIAEQVLGAASDSAIFPAIPAQPLEVELRVPPFSLRQPIDASDARDHELIFEPQPIELEGQVFVGDTPLPGAEITFLVNRLQALPEARQDRVTVTSGAEGRYRATLFAPGHFPIQVALPDRGGLPFQIFPRSYIAASGVLDFHLPDNRFRVQVVDERSGRGIAGAEVEFESSFGEQLSSVISTADHTGEDGRLDLPPFHPGRLQLRVRAACYQEENQEIGIAEIDRGRPVRIALRRLAEGDPVTILLEGGRPAVAAKAALFTGTTDNSLQWWQGNTDEEGKIELPRDRSGSFLLVRHPAAGALALPAALVGDIVRLPQRAPDLELRVRDRAGEPAPTAALAFRLGGVDVAGRALSFLLGNPLPATDRAGTFQATGLPAQRIEVLAWADALLDEALSGALAGQATPIDPREPGGATIVLVE